MLSIIYFIWFLLIPAFVVFHPKVIVCSWQYFKKVRGHSLPRSLVDMYIHIFVYGRCWIDAQLLKWGCFKFYSWELCGGQGIGKYYMQGIGKNGGRAVWLTSHFGLGGVVEAYNLKSLIIKGLSCCNSSVATGIMGVLKSGSVAVIDSKNHSGEAVDVVVEGWKTKISANIINEILASGAPVIFFYVVRLPHKLWRIVIDEQNSLFNSSLDGYTDNSLEAFCLKYVYSLEEMFNDYAYQWLNFEKFFIE